MYSIPRYIILLVEFQMKMKLTFQVCLLFKKLCFLCFSRDRNNILVVMINHVFL